MKHSVHDAAADALRHAPLPPLTCLGAEGGILRYPADLASAASTEQVPNTTEGPTARDPSPRTHAHTHSHALTHKLTHIHMKLLRMLQQWLCMIRCWGN